MPRGRDTTGAENVADPDIDAIDVGVGAWAQVAWAKRLGAFGYGNFRVRLRKGRGRLYLTEYSLIVD
jgi:hypothetical protein